MKREEAHFRFTDPRDITIGEGRIIYSEAFEYRGKHGPLLGHKFIEGWVLPGGERTTNRAEAESAAAAINEAAQKYNDRQHKLARR